MSKKRIYKHYPKEFKDEAVAHVIEQGYSVPDAAKSLGISTSLLYKWKDHVVALKKGNVLTDDERQELKSFRKEVKKLRIEREVLKKATAFFAKEMKFDFIQAESNDYPVNTNQTF